MTKVYISGAISGRPIDEAKAEFQKAAKYVKSWGFTPVNPFDNGVSEAGSWEKHMKADLKMLLDCDAICLIPGWENSRGANIEIRLADTLGMAQLIITRRDLE